MTVTPISLRKSLGKNEYNSFLNKFLIGGLMQTLRDTASYELSVEQAKELGDLVKRSRFTVKETYRDDVHEGLGVVVTINFENGYTLSSFGKFLRKNTDKLKSAGIVEDFLSSKGYRGVPKSYHSIELGRDLAFRSSELIDVAREENGKRAVPKKEKVIKAIARYGIIEPDDEIRKTLKEDNYQTYFKETFFDKLENTSGLEHIVTEFEALGASLDRQKKSIIHNDLHRNNILKARDKSSSTKIIDWDDAAIGAIQKDLFRVNMSVHYNNCLDHSEEREASIKALYDALDSAMRDSGKEHPDSFETFRKNYLIADVLENLNFSAKSLALSKKLAKKGDDDNAIFYKELTDLLYTRALDSLNESGEKELEVKLQYLGEKNSIVRLSREDRIQCEKEQPDKHVGSLRAQLELSDDVIDEQRRLFNQAVNKRIWKKQRNMGVIAASLLAALSYCAYKFIPPAIDHYKARTAISRTIKNNIAEENLLISAPLFIEGAVYKAKKKWPDLTTIDVAIKETIDNDKEGAEEYVEDTNRKLKEIDHYLSPDCKDEVYITRSRFRKLLSEQTTPEEKKAIAKEFLTRNKNKSYAETLLEDLFEDLKPGMFTQKAAGAYSFHVKFISRQDNIILSTEQDWKKFFTEYFSKETAQRLEEAHADYSNSTVVQNENRLSLPRGSLDALVFAGMIEENLSYKLNEYAESNGVKPELLKNDKYFVGMLANYLAQSIDKHKDIAKAFAACLYGDRKVEDAAKLTASDNFFEYKYNLPKEGHTAELTWLYFMQKTENVKEPERMLLTFLTNQFSRDVYREVLQVDALGEDMNKINSRLGNINKTFDDWLKDKK